MPKSVIPRIVSWLTILRGRLKLLFRRRHVALVNESAVCDVLTSLGVMQDLLENEITCTLCGKKLTVENIQAWVVTPDKIDCYCSSAGCLYRLESTRDGS